MVQRTLTHIARNISTASSVALLAVLVFASCMRNSAKELQQVEEEQERASLSVFDLHTAVTDSGYYRYDFETPELHQYDNVEEPYVDFPHGLKFKMYGDRGAVVKSRIRCNKARYIKPANLWELSNDVEATTEKGDVLNTELLYWDTKERRIYSDQFVKITTKNQIITGVGFESDEKLSKYEIKRPGGEIEVENNAQ